MDEVWVPTEFHREVFETHGVHKEKLYVVPLKRRCPNTCMI